MCIIYIYSCKWSILAYIVFVPREDLSVYMCIIHITFIYMSLCLHRWPVGNEADNVISLTKEVVHWGLMPER